MSPFIRKLRHGARLTENDEMVLTKIFAPSRRTGRGDIMQEETEQHSIAVILEGWACRYRYLENGKRQITSILLPGDLCEPFGALPPRMTYSLGALTPVLFGSAKPAEILDAARSSTCIEQALWWDLLQTDAIHREHVISLGRRSATERLGHFFCEIHQRFEMVGLVEQHSCEFVLTQPDLADLFGLSTVQVNRSLQELRGSGLVSLRNRRLSIHDMRGLAELSMFEQIYLPLQSNIRLNS